MRVLIGAYAHARYLGRERRKTLGETVGAFAAYPPDVFPLPHPSWRSRIWMRKNPWFERDALPELRRRVRLALSA